ncbi:MULTISPECIES: DUF1365 domain-containing protein [Thalassotalea]|uniref:DUF1365 domain-containing protein n=1 Tax=Thalassotalea castellviae TaxID=3075612 RepID=A0ABU3A372_9GAMM|nr:DUF1365 domain-containing protein [Thalassotalea sp. W431]MDT0604338.1 DUF1365 domain-containing protein [Thalassotalea sp. W431]
MDNPFSQSYIYLGEISHRRFSPKKHSFKYRLYMLAIDITDIEKQTNKLGLLGSSWYHPLHFVEKDYLPGEPYSLRQRITNKVRLLNGYKDIEKIVMLVQVRCFGIYFSPANFYFCYDSSGKCTQMLAEVSNTPWNERHYYLVDLSTNNEKVNKKAFQVSPFMDLDMSYFWHVKPPCNKDSKLVIHIENKRIDSDKNINKKLFDASLVMNKKPLTKTNLTKVWCQLPVMTIKIVFSIYWQALRLFIKRIPFLGYQKAD